MITLRGTYADECNGPLKDRELRYLCRVFQYGHGREIEWRNAIGEPVDIPDGSVLLQCGAGTWFALYIDVEAIKRG